MAIDHSCAGCGAALARVFARSDPIYGLPIVVCPSCGLAAVRRRHPLARALRGFNRWRATLSQLAVRLGIGVLLIAVSAAMSLTIDDSFAGRAPSRALAELLSGEGEGSFREAWIRRDGPLTAAFGVAWFVVVGVTLTAALGHIQRRWTLWATLIGFVLLIFAIGTIFEGVDWSYRSQSRMSLPDALWHSWQRSWPPLQIFAVGMVVAIVGAPIGRAIRRFADSLYGRVLRARLARARRRRRLAL